MVKKRFDITRQTRLGYMGDEYYIYILKDKLTNKILLEYEDKYGLEDVCVLLNNFWDKLIEYEHSFKKNEEYGFDPKNVNRPNIKLEDMIGIVKSPFIEGRFQEIISTEKIVDTETGIEYDGWMDSELLRLINRII